MDEKQQQEMQQKYMQLQTVGQQMQQMQKQLEMVATQSTDLESTKQALNEISTTELGKEMLVPVASGIFVKGKITDTKDVVVNVGAGTAVKKTTEEAKELISNQQKELDNFKKELEENLNNIAANAHKLEKELSELVK